MSRRDWKAIRKRIRAKYAAPSPRDGKAFWREFRTRAVQDGSDAAPVRVPLSRAPRIPLVWAAAAVLIGVVSAVVLVKLRLETTPPRTARQVPAVEEIEVFVPYTSMMIMQDAEDAGSIVWVTDMESDGSG